MMLSSSLDTEALRTRPVVTSTSMLSTATQ